jgi:hypothetical protein
MSFESELVLGTARFFRKIFKFRRVKTSFGNRETRACSPPSVPDRRFFPMSCRQNRKARLNREPANLWQTIRPQSRESMLSNFTLLSLLFEICIDKGLLLETCFCCQLAFSLTHPSNPQGCRSGVRSVDSRIGSSLSMAHVASKTS